MVSNLKDRKVTAKKVRRQISEELIREVTNTIVKAFCPQKVILFGSLAWGQSRADSDLDIFIIMDSKMRRDERAAQISKLFSYRDFPLDILVYTPKEVAYSLERKNPFIREIMTKGKMLHER